VAVFGAPLDDPDHAASAVRAALQCTAKLSEPNRLAAAFPGRTLRQRIGLNSGGALLGNIGSRRRFNYTVMGDMVNLASRLEGANRFFGTAVIASETTRRQPGDGFAWRELDAVRVKGRAGTVRIFEPLAPADALGRDQIARMQAYAEGLACYRARDFAGAASHFAQFADRDPPSRMLLERSRELAWHPPGPNWEPVNVLEEK
jgi:adenylate cyclase